MTKPPEVSVIQTNTRQEIIEREISLHELMGTLLEAKHLILAIVFLALCLGAGYAFLATPIYRGDALIQVENKSTGMAGFEEITSLFSGEAPAEAEIEIIRSRSIIGAAVDELRLDISAEPTYFPALGAALARHFYSGTGIADPMFGMRQYAWGGEHIQIQQLNVPARYENKALTLIAQSNNTYQLQGPEEEILISGEVGKPVIEKEFYILVTTLIAQPETRFRIIKKSRTSAVRGLQGAISITEMGKKTGVIRLALEGPFPSRITATLDKIAELYVRQNVERHSEEAAKTLKFLQQQLPEIKGKLETAEARLNAYQSGRGSVNLSIETQAVLQKMAEVEKSLSKTDLKRKELAQKFTENHPALVTLRKQEQQFAIEKEALNNQIKQMPKEIQESVRLTRDVQVANEIYLLLLEKAQEMNVVRASTVGNVRVLDSALVDGTAVKPMSTRALLTISALLGLLLGVVVAIIRKSLRRGVEDPEELEQRTGLPVYASVLHSEKQTRLVRKSRNKKEARKLLAEEDNKDLAIESLRSLRTSLQFALMDAKNNIVSISGPSPGIGKSFVAANLAYLLADAGKRILLIDADMRRGHLHEYFDKKQSKGLSEAISGQLQLDEAIRQTGTERLDFIPSGVFPPNPSELLMSERFQTLLEQFSQRYDLVLIDTPPTLAVTDATIIGRLAGINFLVARFAQHPMREIEETVKRFHHAGVKPQGFIFNNIPKVARGYGYGEYGGYGYSYDYK